MNVERRLVLHNAKEESEIYAWLGRLLPRTAQAELAESITAQLQNLPPRFSGAVGNIQTEQP
jgi:hypothetical protein